MGNPIAVAGVCLQTLTYTVHTAYAHAYLNVMFKWRLVREMHENVEHMANKSGNRKLADRGG